MTETMLSSLRSIPDSIIGAASTIVAFQRSDKQVIDSEEHRRAQAVRRERAAADVQANRLAWRAGHVMPDIAANAHAKPADNQHASDARQHALRQTAINIGVANPVEEARTAQEKILINKELNGIVHKKDESTVPNIQQLALTLGNAAQAGKVIPAELWQQYNDAVAVLPEKDQQEYWVNYAMRIHDIQQQANSQERTYPAGVRKP